MYLSNKESYWKDSIDEAISRQNRLSVEYYIDNGNRCTIRKNNIMVLGGLTLEMAYYVVHGIINANKIREVV